MLPKLIGALVALCLLTAGTEAATRADAVASSIGAGVQIVGTSGYATAGDLGAATYKRDTVLTPCGFQSADGAFWTLAEVTVNVAMCGADPADGADDTAAITSAITYVLASSPRRNLFFPPGTWNVIGSGAAIFTITKPIEVYGAGYASLIKLDATVPNTRDIFLYTSTADAIAYTFPLFRDFRIAGVTAGVGRHGINITTLNNGYSYRFGVERMEFTNLAGFGVWADQSAVSTTVNTSWIRDSRFVGNGFGGVSLYDSWVVENNQFTGTGYAIDVTTVVGAGKFTLQSNNITASAGVRFGGPAPVSLFISNNYFETLNTYTGANGAYLDLAGASGNTIKGAVISGNIFTILGSKGDPNAIRLDYAIDTVIDKNWFSVAPVASYCVINTANATRTKIQGGNIYSQVGAGKLSDSGTLAHSSSITSSLISDSTAITNTAAETRFNKVLTIPGGTLTIGDVIRFKVWGLFTIDAAASIAVTIKVYIGAAGAGTQVVAQGLTYPVLTNNDWMIDGAFIVRTVGVSGSLKPTPHVLLAEGVAGSGTAMVGLTATTITFDTTVDRNIEFSIQPASARIGDSFKITGMTMDIITPDKVQ
jgi:hypothetical protein